MKRFVFLAAGLATFWFLSTTSAQAHGRVDKVPCSAITFADCYRIIPDPTIEDDPYPEISLRFGDLVTVHADGCIVEQGVPNSDIPFVEPEGNDTARLHHGRLFLPGATDGAVRLSGLQLLDGSTPLPMRIAMRPDVHSLIPPPHIVYEGAHRGLSVCPGDKAANVVLEIAGAANAPPPDSYISNGRLISDQKLSPFDLVWNSVDENYLPQNPQWYAHLGQRELPTTAIGQEPEGCANFLKFSRRGRTEIPAGCTHVDPDIDDATELQAYCYLEPGHSPFRVYGHVNWGPVTYRGRLYLQGYQYPFPLDLDYHLLLVPDVPNAGVTQGNDRVYGRDDNPSALTLEMNSDETVHLARNVPFFGDREFLWDRENKSAHRRHSRYDPALFVNSFTGEDAQLAGKEAVAIGLLGFDNEHYDPKKGAAAELHPLYGLAVHDAPDVWALLARNWGSEGACSHASALLHGSWDFEHDLVTPWHTLSFTLAKLPNSVPRVSLVAREFKGVPLSAGTEAGAEWPLTFSSGPYPDERHYTLTERDGSVVITVGLPDPQFERVTVLGEVRYFQ